MANGPASTADIMGQIRRLRQEFGSAVCDIIMAELLRGQKTSDLLDKLGLSDPGYGLERLQVLVNYLRQKGSTEFVCHVTSKSLIKGRAAMQTMHVDPALIQALISSDEAAQFPQPGADATIIGTTNVLEKYMEQLFDEPWEADGDFERRLMNRRHAAEADTDEHPRIKAGMAENI